MQTWIVVFEKKLPQMENLTHFFSVKWIYHIGKKERNKLVKLYWERESRSKKIFFYFSNFPLNESNKNPAWQIFPFFLFACIGMNHADENYYLVKLIDFISPPTTQSATRVVERSTARITSQNLTKWLKSIISSRKVLFFSWGLFKTASYSNSTRKESFIF